MKKFLLCTVLVLCISAINANAQRTADGQTHFSIGAAYNFSFSASAEIRGGQYLSFGYWDVGVSAPVYRYKASQTGMIFDVSHIVAEGQMMFRFFASRTRAINLYIGSGVFLGAEVTDLFKHLKDGEFPTLEDGTYCKKTNFIFGLSPRVEAEFFVFPSTALLLYARTPLSFLSQYGLFNAEAGLGVRHNF